MKKIIIVALCAVSTGCISAAYKSTQDALNDISNTYKPILKSDNIYKMPRLLESLRNLNSNLNAHIMGKQGVLLGKKVEGIKAKQKIELDNIFNIWDEMVNPAANNLINLLQTLRITRTDQDARGLLERWDKLGRENAFGSWENIATHVEKIQADAILEAKKKLCKIILSYIEYNINLIHTALNDLKK